MSTIEVAIWGIAGLGWMLDWLTTVWPNKRFPERNPFVVKHFGEYPTPLKFGVAKIIGLLVVGCLYIFGKYLLESFSYLPGSIAGTTPALSIPILIGIVGWAGFLNNSFLLVGDWVR